MSKLENIKAQRQRILGEAGLILSDNGITAEYRAKVAQADTLQSDIELLESMPADIRAKADAAPGVAPAPIVAAPAIIANTDAEERRKRDRAIRSVLRHGLAPHQHAEQRDLVTTSDSTGGAVVAQAFDRAFVEASKYYGPVWNMVHRVDRDNGQPVKIVLSDDTERTFAYLVEGGGSAGAASVKQTPSVSSTVDNLDTLISSVLYSYQEADDADDLDAYLQRIAGVAVARAREVAVTKGTDNTTSAALPHSPTGGLLAGISEGYTQEALADGIGYQNLVTLSGAVDRSYYEAGSFMAHPTTETALRSVEDGMGRPYFLSDPETGLLIITGNKLLYPNNAMPTYGTASAPLVLFGDFSKAYSVVNAGLKFKIVKENENPNLAFDMRELIMYTRIGASAGIPTAVKSFMSAAS